MNELRESGRIQNGRFLMRWRDPLVCFQVFGVCAVQFFLSSSCGVFQERIIITSLGTRLGGQSDFMCVVAVL